MTYFLITVAVEGHTDENSTDVCTVAGTSDRKIRTPKLRETLFSRCGQQVDRWHAKSAASSPMTAHWASTIQPLSKAQMTKSCVRSIRRFGSSTRD